MPLQGCFCKIFAVNAASGSHPDAAFSPDSQYVFGDIVIWSVEDLEFLEILDNDEPHSTLLVHFNLKHIMFVSAGTHLAFYIPSVSPRVTIYIG